FTESHSGMQPGFNPEFRRPDCPSAGIGSAPERLLKIHTAPYGKNAAAGRPRMTKPRALPGIINMRVIQHPPGLCVQRSEETGTITPKVFFIKLKKLTST
ncbi:MAG: hypothetical protein V2I97_25225, partial [Desulfococcaceae bacterium]|nr:hypothetical protein [Desulfococcaceae bacterium]